jgi:hypothetical protein
MPPTSNTLLRSSRLEISEKFSIFHVNLPYRSIGCGPAEGDAWGRRVSRRREGAAIFRRRLARRRLGSARIGANRRVRTRKTRKNLRKASRDMDLRRPSRRRRARRHAPRDRRRSRLGARTGRILFAPRSGDFSDPIEGPSAGAPLRIRGAVRRHSEAPIALALRRRHTLGRTPTASASGAAASAAGAPGPGATPARHRVSTVHSP